MSDIYQYREKPSDSERYGGYRTHSAAPPARHTAARPWLRALLGFLIGAAIVGGILFLTFRFVLPETGTPMETLPLP